MKPFTPYLEKLPKRVVLQITTHGDPNIITGPAMQALYGTAYGTKFKIYKPKKMKMDIGPVSAYWPDAHLKPKSKWTGIWNLQISDFVTAKDLIQKNPDTPVKRVAVRAGTYACILHIGTYASETKTIKALHEYMKAEKLKIVGEHEEVYLSRPGPKAKTIIRYAVSKKT